ncbi:hypothetical protein V8G54_014191 [Vigna mungo]|uniref:Uncharacterized protein n=1 Tax=Vigna mungo TaxID=3915 RepID=A0AAQ3RZ12_VIGMU
MLSIPPATTISLRPNCMVSAASMVAFIPDAHTLLIVVQITDVGIPAPNAACLAGACPKFALRTFPKNTSCTSEGSTFALLRAFLITIEPNSVAERDDREPSKPPIGVRATPTIQTSVPTNSHR